MNDDLIINRIESKIKVLLVSGDVNLKKLLIPYFVKMEISIVVSSSIEEANEVLIANQYDFHLLILTMQNQVDSAVNFISRLRKKHSKSDLPIMYLTSASRNQILSKVFESGCNELLPIPYNTVEFNSKVNSLIELKKLQNMKNELHNLVNVRTKVFRMNTHDLKNPLSSIFSLSGIPIDSFSDKEEISQTFEIIHNAAKIMMSLVNANLEFVNVSSTDIKVEKEQTDIISIVNQIIEINNPLAAKKDQKIIYNYPDMDCNIVTDPNKLYQALNNIIGNAIKFSPIGKKI
jgi:signal transduction histidine kinase